MSSGMLLSMLCPPETGAEPTEAVLFTRVLNAKSALGASLKMHLHWLHVQQ